MQKKSKIKLPSDVELLTAFCCDGQCKNAQLCHRNDFQSELKRIKKCLTRKQPQELSSGQRE